MNTYRERKQAAQLQAITYQILFDKNNCTLFELYQAQQHFTKLAKRYGLIKEFKTNGII